jgi:hypothetical protein
VATGGQHRYRHYRVLELAPISYSATCQATTPPSVLPSSLVSSHPNSSILFFLPKKISSNRIGTFSVSNPRQSSLRVMHEYEACPLHTNDISPNDINPNDISPKVENRISNGFPSQDNSASTFEGSTTSEVSSLHSSLDPPIANPSSASPSKFHVDPLGSTGSDAGNHHSLPSTRGISKWQTAWRLQTFVLGLYVLCTSQNITRLITPSSC